MVCLSRFGSKLGSSLPKTTSGTVLGARVIPCTFAAVLAAMCVKVTQPAALAANEKNSNAGAGALEATRISWW